MLERKGKPIEIPHTPMTAKKIYNMKSISFANSNWQFLELKIKQGQKPTFCGFSYKPSLLIILLSRKSLIF